MALPKEIIFTSGATEANNLAIIGIARKAKPEKNKILVSSIEHKCVLEASRYLSGQGFIVQQRPVDDIGLVDLSALEDSMDEDVLLVSIMTVNNEIGTIHFDSVGIGIYSPPEIIFGLIGS